MSKGAKLFHISFEQNLFNLQTSSFKLVMNTASLILMDGTFIFYCNLDIAEWTFFDFKNDLMINVIDVKKRVKLYSPLIFLITPKP